MGGCELIQAALSSSCASHIAAYTPLGEYNQHIGNHSEPTAHAHIRPVLKYSHKAARYNPSSCMVAYNMDVYVSLHYYLRAKGVGVNGESVCLRTPYTFRSAHHMSS